MNIERIKPPKYRVGRHVINEYELRKLMLSVCKGEIPSGIKVKDVYNKTATIQPDGSLDVNLYGIDLMSKFTIDMLRIRREK
jgi:hypothetical protein